MQRNGLEWSYRLMREPRRLWRRYARYNPRFVVAFARQYAQHRRESGGMRAGELQAAQGDEREPCGRACHRRASIGCRP